MGVVHGADIGRHDQCAATIHASPGNVDILPIEEIPRRESAQLLPDVPVGRQYSTGEPLVWAGMKCFGNSADPASAQIHLRPGEPDRAVGPENLGTHQAVGILSGQVSEPPARFDVQLSVGIEQNNDLAADGNQALRAKIVSVAESKVAIGGDKFPAAFLPERDDSVALGGGVEI